MNIAFEVGVNFCKVEPAWRWMTVIKQCREEFGILNNCAQVYSQSKNVPGQVERMRLDRRCVVVDLQMPAGQSSHPLLVERTFQARRAYFGFDNTQIQKQKYADG